jgi:hypothetical protein
VDTSKSNNALMLIIVALIASALGAYGVYALLIKPDFESTKEAQKSEIKAAAEAAKREIEASREAQREGLKKDIEQEVAQATEQMQSRADEVWAGEAARKAFAKGIAEASAMKVMIAENFMTTGALCEDNASCALKSADAYKDEAITSIGVKQGVITIRYSDRFEKPAPIVRLTPTASLDDGSIRWRCETNAVAMLPPEIDCAELR